MILRIDHIGLAAEDAVGAAVLLRALNFDKKAAGVAEAYQVNRDLWRISGELAGGVTSRWSHDVTNDLDIAAVGPRTPWHLAGHGVQGPLAFFSFRRRRRAADPVSR